MSYPDPLIKLFQKHANKENAFHMKRYMLNQYEFFGIKTPEKRVLQKQFVQENRIILGILGIGLLTGCAKEPEACFTPSRTTILVGDFISFSNCSHNADYFSYDFGYEVYGIRAPMIG
ncbi:MAG: DNA alkylation repair protein [Bacteroidetes bacterium]|nr:DNA alkylation repair protein [Bacteroidota bacterium]